MCHVYWLQMLEENQETILVMEDDVKFKTFFSRGLSEVILEANRYVPDWDHMWALKPWRMALLFLTNRRRPLHPQLIMLPPFTCIFTMWLTIYLLSTFHSYIGRHKVNRAATEPLVPKTKLLVKPGHSYLMLCYLLSRRGAKKLLAAEPLRKLIPTDEFISLMRGTPATKWVLPNWSWLLTKIAPRSLVLPLHTFNY